MSSGLFDLLEGRAEPGVYRFRSRAGAATVNRLAGRCGWRFFHLDGRQIVTKIDFLAACAAALHLPAYFGYNWDALADSLSDLAAAPGVRGDLLLYDSASRFAAAEPAEFAVALDILREESEARRAASAPPLAVLLRGLGRGAPALPEL